MNNQEVAAYNTEIRQMQAWGLDASECIKLQGDYKNLLPKIYPLNLRVDVFRTIRQVRPW
jgi:hypothetical protein